MLRSWRQATTNQFQCAGPAGAAACRLGGCPPAARGVVGAAARGGAQGGLWRRGRAGRAGAEDTFGGAQSRVAICASGARWRGQPARSVAPAARALPPSWQPVRLRMTGQEQLFDRRFWGSGQRRCWGNGEANCGRPLPALFLRGSLEIAPRVRGSVFLKGGGGKRRRFGRIWFRQASLPDLPELPNLPLKKDGFECHRYFERASLGEGSPCPTGDGSWCTGGCRQKRAAPLSCCVAQCPAQRDRWAGVGEVSDAGIDAVIHRAVGWGRNYSRE